MKSRKRKYKKKGKGPTESDLLEAIEKMQRLKLTKNKSATKIQSLKRGKTTRKHIKRLELYNKLPEDLQRLVNKKVSAIPILEEENSQLLLEGAKEGNLAKVKYALDNYANIDTTDEYGNTPLHLASEKGHLEVVQILLDAGADIEATDRHGNTPLQIASWEGHTEVVRILLDAGANKDVTNNEDGDTPLHWASYEGHTGVVQLLLNAGANIEARNDDRMTPLQYASESGHTEIVELLENYTPSTSGSGKKKTAKKKRSH
jgi:ankyrin repeat protein